MLTAKKSSFLKNKKGMAVLEIIPTLFVYMLLINFGLGFFGAIHAGILHNIAARNYSFEAMRHRPNLLYHRVYDPQNNFSKTGYRFGGIIFDRATEGDNKWIAPTRPIAFSAAFGGNDSTSGIDLSSRGPANEPNAATLHNGTVKNLNEDVRNTNVAVSQIWIKSLYGICINSQCGDSF